MLNNIHHALLFWYKEHALTGGLQVMLLQQVLCCGCSCSWCTLHITPQCSHVQLKMPRLASLGLRVWVWVVQLHLVSDARSGAAA